MVRDRARRSACRRRAAPEHPRVADAPRDAVRVHPLEQQLRVAPADAGEVAEARERDPAGGRALRPHQLDRALVRCAPTRVAVAEPDEPTRALEDAGRGRDRRPSSRPARLGELVLDRNGLGGPRAERRRGARTVEPGAAPLEPEQRLDVPRPRLCRRLDPRVERIGAVEPGSSSARSPSSQARETSQSPARSTPSAPRRGDGRARRRARARRSSQPGRPARAARTGPDRRGAAERGRAPARPRSSSRRAGSTRSPRAATTRRESRSCAQRSPARATRAGLSAVPRCTVTRAPSAIGTSSSRTTSRR